MADVGMDGLATRDDSTGLSDRRRVVSFGIEEATPTPVFFVSADSKGVAALLFVSADSAGLKVAVFSVS